MALVKTIKCKNATVNIHDDYIPTDLKKYKQNLKIVYDTINMIFKDKNREDLFYTEEELKTLDKELFI